MSACAWCKNEYDKTFSVTYAGKTYDFDSFECAITMLAPTCGHCACRMIGHGQEVDGRFYCCANCARLAEHVEVHDRSSTESAVPGRP
ncbi:MAG: hypothetical protein ACT4R6_05100 [Gemmatimonadaceae bacterium]